MQPRSDLLTFKRAVRHGGAMPFRPVLRKLATVQPAPGEGRTLRFVASTGAVDRDGDTVALAGWRLDAFRRNPVILFSHLADTFPVGKATHVGVLDGALRVTIEFVPRDVPIAGEMAEAAFRLSKAGFLSAVSVGFKPLAYKLSNDKERADKFGIDFTAQELYEISLVTVPANAEALIEPGQRASVAVSAQAALRRERAALRALAWS